MPAVGTAPPRRGAIARAALRGTVLLSFLCSFVLAGGCRRREPPEVSRLRAQAQYLQEQVESLEALVGKAERGELDTQSQIAVSVSEKAVRELMGASLPREVVIGEHLRLNVETARAYFQGNRAALTLRARVASTALPQAHATLELAGYLEDFRLEQGRLVSRISLAQFSVVEASVGELGADVLEGVVKGHLEAVQRALPPIVLPVLLQESIRIDALKEGVVVAKPGTLPLTVGVARVLPGKGRLWILLDAKAGPWKPAAAEGAS
jgi:hypothetical protein